MPKALGQPAGAAGALENDLKKPPCTYLEMSIGRHQRPFKFCWDISSIFLNYLGLVCKESWAAKRPSCAKAAVLWAEARPCSLSAAKNFRSGLAVNYWARQLPIVPINFLSGPYITSPFRLRLCFLIKCYVCMQRNGGSRAVRTGYSIGGSSAHIR